jgi:hypothetical protein
MYTAKLCYRCVLTSQFLVYKTAHKSKKIFKKLPKLMLTANSSRKIPKSFGNDQKTLKKLDLIYKNQLLGILREFERIVRVQRRATEWILKTRRVKCPINSDY